MTSAGSSLFLGQKGHRSVRSVRRLAVTREVVMHHKLPELNVTVINFSTRLLLPLYYFCLEMLYNS